MAWRDPQTGEYVAPIAGIRAASREEAVQEALRRLGGPPAPYAVQRIEAGRDPGAGGIIQRRDTEKPAGDAQDEFFVRVTLQMPPGHEPLLDQARAVLADRPPHPALRLVEVEAFGDLLWDSVSLLEICTTDFVRVESHGHYAVIAELRGEVRYFLGSREMSPGHAALSTSAPSLAAALAEVLHWLGTWDEDACGKAMWPVDAAPEALRAKFAALCRMEAFEAAARVAEHAFEAAEAAFGPGHSRIAGVLKDYAREYDLTHRAPDAEALRERARSIIHSRLHP